MTEPVPPSLEQWTSELAATLGLPSDLAGDDARALVLDLARDVAHGVARPAAPLSTFLAGVAVGRAGAATDDLRGVAQEIRRTLPGV